MTFYVLSALAIAALLVIAHIVGWPSDRWRP